ncbi:MAG TPA: hypothetical protein VF383_12885, partial [Candidatus Dormibacteraeota bacterium]
MQPEVSGIDSKSLVWTQGKQRSSGLSRIAAHCLNYATNHVVNRIPSYSIRRGWYRSVMGI